MEEFKKRFWRYTIPTLLVFSAYLGILYWLDGRVLSIKEIISAFLLGQYGAGAYYYGFMIQFLLIYPLVFVIVDKWNGQGVILVGLLNLFYELFYQVYEVDLSRFQLNEGSYFNLYRVLIFRYLLMMALGVWLYRNRDEEIENIRLIQMLSIGIIWLLIPGYLEGNYRVFVNWSNVSMMVSFYVFPLMYIIFRYCLMQEKISGGIRCLEIIGKASYHIMYTQLLYFEITLRGFGISSHIQNGLVRTIYAVLVSVVTGIGFYYLDKKLFGKIYIKK